LKGRSGKELGDNPYWVWGKGESRVTGKGGRRRGGRRRKEPSLKNSHLGGKIKRTKLRSNLVNEQRKRREQTRRCSERENLVLSSRGGTSTPRRTSQRRKAEVGPLFRGGVYNCPWNWDKGKRLRDSLSKSRHPKKNWVVLRRKTSLYRGVSRVGSPARALRKKIPSTWCVTGGGGGPHQGCSTWRKGDSLRYVNKTWTQKKGKTAKGGNPPFRHLSSKGGFSSGIKKRKGVRVPHGKSWEWSKGLKRRKGSHFILHNRREGRLLKRKGETCLTHTHALGTRGQTIGCS